jgi:hypothetical protein
MAVADGSAPRSFGSTFRRTDRQGMQLTCRACLLRGVVLDFIDLLDFPRLPASSRPPDLYPELETGHVPPLPSALVALPASPPASSWDGCSGVIWVLDGRARVNPPDGGFCLHSSG